MTDTPNTALITPAGGPKPTLTEQVHALHQRYHTPNYAPSLLLTKGRGAYLWDADGKRYLDFVSGIAVTALGHCHPRLVKAIARQAKRLLHVSNLYYNDQAAFLAETLSDLSLGGKVLFCNSGAEANEGLIKLARRFGSASGRHRIVTFTGSFHGRTMACITATGQDKVKKDFGPLLDGFVHAPFNDAGAARAAVDEKTAAILVEPVQGEGGIHPATPEFLRALRALCDEKNLLLLFDEVQCGLGRTGDWCGWRSIAPDVEPDGVSWAKGIANGFPLGSFWASSKSFDARGPLCDLLGAGSHGTTYGGNPVCCAAGSKVLEIIERDGLLAKSVELGSKLAAGLASIHSPWISEIRHLGLMIGVELSPAFPDLGRPPALEAVHRAMAAGLLLIPAGERVVRFLPPLNVQPAEIDEAVEKFAAVLGAVAAPSQP